MKAPDPPDFIESDELRDQRAKSKALRLGYKIGTDQSGYRLWRIWPAKNELIAENQTLDQLEEWLDRFEEEDPAKLMKDIMAENPGATEGELRKLFMAELRSSENLQETIAKEVRAKLYREEKGSGD